MLVNDGLILKRAGHSALVRYDSERLPASVAPAQLNHPLLAGLFFPSAPEKPTTRNIKD